MLVDCLEHLLEVFMEDIEEGNATDLEELELNIEEGIDNFLDEIKY